MVQQSNHETTRIQKQTQGRQTREQQKAVFEGRENTKGADVDPHQDSIEEARAGQKQSDQAYDNSSGDRTIKRGANQESEHMKRRSEH